MAGPTLPEELLLAGHPADRPFGGHGGVLAIRVAGAALGELVLTDRLESAEPTGHPLLDAMRADRSGSDAEWVHRWAARAYAHTRDALVAQGALRPERRRRLWLRTDVTRLPEGDPGRAALIERLREPEGRRDRLLAALLHALRGTGAPDDWIIETVRRATRISVD
ncbi:GPP34 family phosphoprotein [Dactylosporangium sp. CA-139066]|uniref:GPP34 family phosphoprotein n=1 Tax=Dactylosporangium sp. CA-139066 TaxID=3239930 RepID=UPI003D928AD2